MNFEEIYKLGLLLIISMGQLFAYGFGTYYIFKNKGYKQNWFWFGFFFGLVGLIISACIPKREKVGVQLPQYNISKSDRTRINGYFYKLHMFKLPYFLVGSFTGIIELSLILSLIFMLFEYAKDSHLFNGIGDLLKAELIIAGLILGILIIAALIILIVMNSWKREDSIEELVYQAQKAKLLDIYTANNYLEMLSADVENTEFKCTYCGITDKFINGIVHSREIMTYQTIAIPRDRIVKIVFDLRTKTGFVSGHLSTWYVGGINVHLNNGEVVILNYGTKFEIKKIIDALSKIGVKTEIIK